MDWVALFTQGDEDSTGAPAGVVAQAPLRVPRDRHDEDLTDAMEQARAQARGRGGADRGRHTHARSADSGDEGGPAGAADGVSAEEERDFAGPPAPSDPPAMETTRIILQDTPTNRKFVSAAQAQIDRALQGAVDESSSASTSAAAGRDSGPRRIPLAAKYGHVVRAAYKARTYRSVDTTSDDDDEESADAQRTAHREECFLCSWGDRFHDGLEAPAVIRLNLILDLNYGLVDNRAIAQMMHIYFKERIYDPTRGMAMLTQETVLEHIEQMHSLDPRIMLGETIRMYQRLIAVLQNEIFYGNGSFGRFQFAALNQATRQLLMLYKSDPVKMNFYDAKRAINPKVMGALMNIRAEFTQHGRKRKAATAHTPAGAALRVSGGGKKRARDDASLAAPSAKRPRIDI
jgi:hypothetical protein